MHSFTSTLRSAGNLSLMRLTRLTLALIWIVISTTPLFAQGGQSVTASSLRSEYLASPLAIDTREPRLSWQIESTTRGAKQTAYQIIVASTRARLASNIGDLWDTRKVD